MLRELLGIRSRFNRAAGHRQAAFSRRKLALEPLEQRQMLNTAPLVQFNPPGFGFDPSFGASGTVLTPIADGGARVASIVLEADGKILAGGTAQSGGQSVFALAQYNPDGTLDATFGVGGIVTTTMGAGDASLAKVAIQTDGRIVAAGTASTAAGIREVAVAQYNADGQLDPTFADHGRLLVSVQGADTLVGGMAIQSDGKIVVGGTWLGGGSVDNYGQDLFLRCNSDGTLDSTWNGGGTLIIQPPWSFRPVYDSLLSVAVQSDGKIVALVDALATGGGPTALIRCMPNGSLDTSFGTNGRANTGVVAWSSYSGDMTIQADGKLVAGLNESGYPYICTLVRFNQDGSIDATILDAITSDRRLTYNAVGMQANGQIVVAGMYPPGPYESQNFMSIARYNADFTLDQAFGDRGLFVTPLEGGANSVAIQPDGKVIAAGGSNGLFTLFRAEASPPTLIIQEGMTFTATGQFTDPDPDTWTATVDYGDGSGPAALALAPDKTFSLNHLYARPGAYRVTVTVQDDAGAVDTAHATLSVGGGTAAVGLFDPSASTFHLRSSNDPTDGSGVAFGFGQPSGGWKTLAGDWDGDGVAGVGLYDPATSIFYLTNAFSTGTAEMTFGYGAAGGGWIPLVGDWDGDGRMGVGLYDPHSSTFYLTSSLATGVAQYTFGYGAPNGGWVPLVGDWNGDGVAGVGLYDPQSSVFYLTNAFQTGAAEVTFGYGAPGSGWIPLLGDWNGDGHAGVGLYDAAASTFYLTNAQTTGVAEYTFSYGAPGAGWIPLAGDWQGDGATGVALYDPHASTFYLTNALSTGIAEYTLGYGVGGAGWTPLVGHWQPSGG